MTDRSDQRVRAARFHRLHDELLVLPNAWDPPSARMIEGAGAVAIASTSAGVAWSRGVADAGGLDRSTALDAAARMVAAVSVPVTLDVEWGYPDDPGGVEVTIEEVIATGAVGINLEDSPCGHPGRGRGPVRPDRQGGGPDRRLTRSAVRQRPDRHLPDRR